MKLLPAMRKLAVENKKLAFYLVALVAIGAFALILTRNSLPSAEEIFTGGGGGHAATLQQEAHNHAYHASHAPDAFAQERALEARLEEFFSLVEGAGQVRVMISPLAGLETVFAVDENLSRSVSNEQDAQGGTRETETYQSGKQTVIITDRQGTDRPLVVREIHPQVQGIVIIAEGGGSPFVRDALTRAAMAMLGIDAHNIQVLNMKGE